MPPPLSYQIVSGYTNMTTWHYGNEICECGCFSSAKSESDEFFQCFLLPACESGGEVFVGFFCRHGGSLQLREIPPTDSTLLCIRLESRCTAGLVRVAIPWRRLLRPTLSSDQCLAEKPLFLTEADVFISFSSVPTSHVSCHESIFAPTDVLDQHVVTTPTSLQQMSV